MDIHKNKRNILKMQEAWYNKRNFLMKNYMSYARELGIPQESDPEKPERTRKTARGFQKEGIDPFEKLYNDLTNTLRENFFGRIFELSQLKDVNRDKARRDPEVLEELGGYFMKQINEAYERHDATRLEELRWKLAREIAYYKSIGIPFPPKRRETREPQPEALGKPVSGAFAERFHVNGEKLITEITRDIFFKSLPRSEQEKWQEYFQSLEHEYHNFLESAQGRGAHEPAYHIKNLKTIFEIIQREYDAFMEKKESGNAVQTPTRGWSPSASNVKSAPEKFQKQGFFARAGNFLRGVFKG